jgi:hypothetical protein
MVKRKGNLHIQIAVIVGVTDGANIERGRVSDIALESVQRSSSLKIRQYLNLRGI